MNSIEKELELYKVALNSFNNFMKTYEMCNLYVYKDLNDNFPLYYKNFKYDHEYIKNFFNCSKISEIASGKSNIYHCLIYNDSFMMCDSLERIKNL